jgi:hypothetical protein
MVMISAQEEEESRKLLHQLCVFIVKDLDFKLS